MTHGKSIVVVDDVPMFRELVSLFLARTAEVRCASSAEEALGLIEARRPDLVLADLHMPGMGGDGLCRRLRDRPDLADIPLVMLLRAESVSDRSCAIRAGANDVLTKPLARTELIDSVNHFLEAGLSCGLPRVQLETPVQLSNALMNTWGTARNISRGGIAVEADCELEPKTTIRLDLNLPDTGIAIDPTAEVVWSRESPDLRSRSLGLRFLRVSEGAMRSIDDFIADHLDHWAPGPSA